MSIGSDTKKEPTTHVLLIGKKADDKGEQLYARLAHSKNVVKVAAKNVDRLSKVVENPAVLRNRDLVQLDTSRVDAIDVQLGDHPAFKLRKSGDGGLTFTNVPGATSSTYTFTASLNDNGKRFRATLTNPCGSALSGVASLAVNAAPSATITHASHCVPLTTSRRKTRPISTANTTLVSRSADTVPIAPDCIAQITMP